MAPVEVTEDYYDVLKIPNTATIVQIKKSYHVIARHEHPDKNGNSEQATAFFQLVQCAYETLRDVGRRREYDILWPSIVRSPTAQRAAVDRKADENRRSQERAKRKAEAEAWEKRRREEELRKAEAEQEERRRKIEELRKAEVFRERKRREHEAEKEEIRQWQEQVRRKEEAEREEKRRKAEDASAAEADQRNVQHPPGDQNDPVAPSMPTHERPTLSISSLWKLRDQKDHLARDVFETNRVIRRLGNEIERISTQIVDTDAELKTHDSNANSWSSYVFSALHGEQQKIQNNEARDLILRKRLDLINVKAIKESSLQGKKVIVAEWESNIRGIEEAMAASNNSSEKPQDTEEHQKRERLRERLRERMEEQQNLKNLRAEEGEQLKRERLRERMEEQQKLKNLRAEEGEQLKREQARKVSDAQVERERIRKQEKEDQERKQEEIRRRIAEQQKQEQLRKEIDDDQTWANIFADIEHQAEVQRQRELKKGLEEKRRAQEAKAKKEQEHRRKFDEYLARCNIFKGVEGRDIDDDPATLDSGSNSGSYRNKSRSRIPVPSATGLPAYSPSPTQTSSSWTTPPDVAPPPYPFWPAEPLGGTCLGTIEDRTIIDDGTALWYTKADGVRVRPLCWKYYIGGGKVQCWRCGLVCQSLEIIQQWHLRPYKPLFQTDRLSHCRWETIEVLPGMNEPLLTTAITR